MFYQKKEVNGKNKKELATNIDFHHNISVNSIPFSPTDAFSLFFDEDVMNKMYMKPI